MRVCAVVLMLLCAGPALGASPDGVCSVDWTLTADEGGGEFYYTFVEYECVEGSPVVYREGDCQCNGAGTNCACYVASSMIYHSESSPGGAPDGWTAFEPAVDTGVCCAPSPSGWENNWGYVVLWCCMLKGFEFGIWFGRARQRLL